MEMNNIQNLCQVADMILRRTPDARALVKGSAAYPNLMGTVSFFGTSSGVLVLADFKGLPAGTGNCRAGSIFAFHIHEGGSCTGSAQDPFADADGHYNPGTCPHPYHAGDMPPLFGNNGIAWTAFLTDRFKVPEIVGRTVVVHASPDDFTTQPSGNSGAKIACGIIEPA